MPLPQAPVTLQNQCTIIYNGKLYSYQPDAFQVLDLKPGGTWSKLSMGVPVNGSKCVQGTFDDKPAFIVVGGSTTTTDFHGVQHYDLTSDKWTSDRPVDDVAVNRHHHGIAFLPQSSAILMYAGSQDSVIMPSTQTFLIHTKAPYAVEAFESSAPPVTDPLMLTYNASHALMLGGSSSNKDVFLFSANGGWSRLNTSLQNPLADASKTQATLHNSSDGRKSLQIFNLGASPNQVSTVSLSNATSAAVSSTSASRSAKLRRQDSTPAPADARSAFSLAEDSNLGLVVATGGSSQSPLVMYNQTSSQWIDANQFFGNEPATTSSITSSTSASSSATSSPSSSPAATSASPAATHSAQDRSLTILGAVLGGVFGAALILVLAFLFLRFRRHQRREARQRGEYAMETKKEPLDFSDMVQGYPKSPLDSGAVTPEVSHQRNKSQRSVRSVDPRLIDRNMTASSESKRALLHARAESNGSSASFWGRGKKSPSPLGAAPQISAPILGPPLSKSLMVPEAPIPSPRAETGWSQYFVNDGVKDNYGNPQGPPQTQAADDRPNTYLSTIQSQSDYTSSRINSTHPHESAEVEPLAFRDSRPMPPTTGITSPSTSRPGLGLAITHGPSPDKERDEVEDADRSRPSTSSDFSNPDDLHHYSHGSDGYDSWTPVATSAERDSGWTNDRPDSNSVTNSRLYAHPGERVEIPVFPMPNSSRNSLAAVSPKVRSPTGGQDSPSAGFPDVPAVPMSPPAGMRNVNPNDFVRTKSGRLRPAGDIQTGTQRVLAASPGPTSSSTAPDTAQTSSFRTLPRPRQPPTSPESAMPGTRGQGQDMSWLNLGTSAEQQQRGRDMYFPDRQ